ncbi:MAG: RNA polymerase sigma-70 factor (ECF subfamily) [Planctomycetota bacterium]|jgi:RNA polymerase sigma-70 factor (ECF subfamily)
MGNKYLEDLDVQLMLRVRNGDDEAFATIVEKHASMLVNFMYRYVGCRVTGEDLAQDVFMRVFRAAPNYEPKARFKTWLLTIATNICLNQKRWEKHRNHLSLSRDDQDDGPRGSVELDSGAESPDDSMEKEELRERVRDAIAGLPEKQRAALLLRRYEQLSYAEIATSLGLSLMAVKSLLNRAKEGLKERLGRDLEDWYPASSTALGDSEKGLG